MGVGFAGKVRLERVFEMQVERETGQMDLMLRKVIVRSCLSWGAGVSTTSVMARWSDMERSVLEILWMWRPLEQTRSKMCPRLWVGKLMCCVKPRQLIRSRKSMAFLQSGESMCRLKSPRSKTDGEIEESAVMNSESSGRNDGCCWCFCFEIDGAEV